MYANVETCPEELLLFFHHMPYNYVLKSGKTILQHIYDTHFEGAEDAARFYDEVVTLKPYLDPAVYAAWRHALPTRRSTPVSGAMSSTPTSTAKRASAMPTAVKFTND